MGAGAYITPIGSIISVIPPGYTFSARIMPPSRFDASAVNTSVSLRPPNNEYGFYPVHLGRSWRGHPLCLKLEVPGSQGDQFDEEMKWYSWADRLKIGAAYYGVYEFNVKERPGRHRGLLMEMVMGDPICISQPLDSVRSLVREDRSVEQRWNEKSERTFRRIGDAITRGGIFAADLELLLCDDGRLVLIDPGLFDTIGSLFGRVRASLESEDGIELDDLPYDDGLGFDDEPEW